MQSGVESATSAMLSLNERVGRHYPGIHDMKHGIRAAIAKERLQCNTLPKYNCSKTLLKTSRMTQNKVKHMWVTTKSQSRIR